jgi:hypothetical protein
MPPRHFLWSWATCRGRTFKATRQPRETCSASHTPDPRAGVKAEPKKPTESWLAKTLDLIRLLPQSVQEQHSSLLSFLAFEALRLDE